MILSNALKRMEKEVVMACFKVLFQHLPGVTDEDYRNLRIADLQAKN
jgi:hypothetical protein